MNPTFKQSLLVIALASTHAFAGVSVAGMDSTLNNEIKEASDFTIKKNNELYKTFPFEDLDSFKNANRGFIAPLNDDGIIKNDDGEVVWDLKVYQDFIKQGEAAPDTINPSLWRQSQLTTISGLFEVVPGVYQVRGADLSNMTIVEGDEGLTIYDPLVSAETAAAALELYYQHRPEKPIVAVLYTHSHVDHFGGVRGIVSQEDVDNGKVKIYAPEGFLDDAIAENVLTGTAMSRRASYMYGNAAPPGEKGSVGAGLGITTSSGTVTLIPPTDIIKETGETRVIDGIEYEFLMAPGSEAPSEMMWYLPKFKMINTAEDAVHSMHNLYTLRGAKTRDASKWPEYLNEAIMMWGDEAEVAIGMHHWPEWGSEVIPHIKSQRDTYKFLHDQTLHFANQGYTMNELSEKVILPESLVDQWSTHGYYGTQSHNVRAVYNFYLGYFNGNPATLDPLTPVEEAKHYVAAIGGEDNVFQQGKKAFDAGDYKWAATLTNNLVFANPDNEQARYLQADIFEQLGYQAENGPWRNFYLSGAMELRNGVTEAATPNTASLDVTSNMSSKLIFDYMGVQLNAERAEGKTLTVNYNFQDVEEKHTLYLENSVLNAFPDWQDERADVTINLDRATLNHIMVGQTTMEQAIADNLVTFEGDQAKYFELMGLLDDLSKDFWFNIATP
ncbi:alkyl/aryl-sulfatase [Vibrio genomosp. F10]|uniref:alkyl/aryl-sulfatase n=1 Tax=Vibrio genomosp. F10 TaxID=723171 RepID=UPI0002F1A846|nr:alkyl sulfatase dimerization domain-containing protein [Vibrio genomosp. F10]OEF04969.1 hypothetical protein A1QI_09525 [Vibrio genomosp. F10 str. 9ZB36]